MRRGHFLGSAAAAGLATWAGPVLASPPASSVNGTTFSLASNGIGATWSIDGGTLRMVSMRDLIGRIAIAVPKDLFTLTLADDSVVPASAFAVASTPRVVRKVGSPGASRYASRIGETSIFVDLTHAATGARATWRAIASDGATYLRQELTLAATAAPLRVRSVQLVGVRGVPDVLVHGSCDGSPAVAGNLFFALEHPFAQAEGVYDRVYISLPRKLDVLPGAPLVASMVVGATAPGQLRRGFLEYIERERAHPYRTFLHYNSWYDIGYFTRYDAAECLTRITAFGEELRVKRNVKLESFLFDDGWDDPNDLWHFNSGFPDGFAPLKAAAAKYGARPGAWLSPWGGYGKPREQRLAAAKAAGYEIDDGGLALSGPKYYERFHDVVMSLIRDGGVNQFKLDGTGDSANVVPGSRFGNDFEAAIALIGAMRAAEPDIFVNLTTGTYPSPFWLNYCDSIWRGGYDHNFTGVGTHRQKWITYRDADTYAGIVTAGPLYPLNSVMLHGVLYAQHAKHLSDDPGHDLRSEIASYFGSGTQLQELYITPSLLTSQNWDDIGDAARYSAGNADVLRDTHWVGGNPDRLDVYGWASWAPRKGILTLRNPSSKPQSIPIDVARVFELPEHAPKRYALQPAWADAPAREILQAGREHAFTLAPFEVRVLDAIPF